MTRINNDTTQREWRTIAGQNIAHLWMPNSHSRLVIACCGLIAERTELSDTHELGRYAECEGMDGLNTQAGRRLVKITKKDKKYD